MNKYQRGAEILQREINRVGDMMELREVLDNVGVLQQAADEAKSNIEKAKAEESAANTRAEEANLAAATATEAAVATGAEAAQGAERVLKEARDQAATIRDAATADAAKAVGEATARVNTINDEIAKLTAQRDAVRSELSDVQGKLAEVEDSREVLRRKLG